MHNTLSIRIPTNQDFNSKYPLREDYTPEMAIFKRRYIFQTIDARTWVQSQSIPPQLLWGFWTPLSNSYLYNIHSDKMNDIAHLCRYTCTSDPFQTIILGIHVSLQQCTIYSTWGTVLWRSWDFLYCSKRIFLIEPKWSHNESEQWLTFGY